MEKVINWIMKHKKTTIVLLILVIFAPMIVIHLLYKIHLNCYWIESEWESGEMLGYYGSVLSFVGTIVLGYIAILQAEKANRMNDELLEIEKNRIKPCLDISTSKLYSIYLADDMYEKREQICRNKVMIINLLFPKNPRTGFTTSSALIELEVCNSGGSDIRRIFINQMCFYFSVADPFNYKEKKILSMGGNTTLKVGEKKKLYIDIRREISSEDELGSSWYQDNINKIMPYIEIEFILETATGYSYSEKIICESSWDINMPSTQNTTTRSIGISEINIKKYNG